jgi:hypothetical protein
LASSITGSSVDYSAGGGGMRGAGGSDGSSGTGWANTANTGHGGNNVTNNSGQSGVVILRMLTSNYSGTTTGSPTVSTSGSDTIVKFTGSGSYTA